MTKRSQWCEFNKETRKYIKKRDNNECVICHSRGALQIMHIFLSRAKGGKGSKDNGCLGCVKCHRIIDNPLGEIENIKSTQYLDFCKKYLIEKEKINLNKEFINSLKYKKQLGTPTIDLTQINMDKPKDKCKSCKMLVKNKNSQNSIPNYYCKYRKITISKNSPVCRSYEKRF